MPTRPHIGASFLAGAVFARGSVLPIRRADAAHVGACRALAYSRCCMASIGPGLNHRGFFLIAGCDARSACSAAPGGRSLSA